MPETDQLTEREIEVICLLIQQPDFSNKKLAGELGIAPGTFANHAAHIYDKLGVNTRLGAVCQFMRRYPDYLELFTNGN